MLIQINCLDSVATSMVVKKEFNIVKNVILIYDYWQFDSTPRIIGVVVEMEGKSVCVWWQQ